MPPPPSFFLTSGCWFSKFVAWFEVALKHAQLWWRGSPFVCASRNEIVLRASGWIGWWGQRHVATLHCHLVLYSFISGQAHISFRILLDGFTHLIFGRRKKKHPEVMKWKFFSLGLCEKSWIGDWLVKLNRFYFGLISIDFFYDWFNFNKF